MNANAENSPATPPVTPDSDEAMPNNSSFAATCLSQMQALPLANEWKLGRQLLTQSDQWGAVCRIDFEIAGDDIKPLVNRIIFWQLPHGDIKMMFAIGQNVPPL